MPAVVIPFTCLVIGILLHLLAGHQQFKNTTVAFLSRVMIVVGVTFTVLVLIYDRDPLRIIVELFPFDAESPYSLRKTLT